MSESFARSRGSELARIESTAERRVEFMEADEILTFLKQYQGKTLVGKRERAAVESPAKRLHEIHTTLLTPAECFELGLPPANDVPTPVTPATLSSRQ